MYFHAEISSMFHFTFASSDEQWLHCIAGGSCKGQSSFVAVGCPGSSSDNVTATHCDDRLRVRSRLRQRQPQPALPEETPNPSSSPEPERRKTKRCAARDPSAVSSCVSLPFS
uniref:ZP domain-containing protein n=1 Tax=Panagrellus redivivus TaxID=6233 RepID=A0A7E4W750_PANRE